MLTVKTYYIIVANTFMCIAEGSFVRRSLTGKRETLYQNHDITPMNSGSSSRNGRYLYVSRNGVLHPVVNETTVAVNAGYLTLIGLGFLSVLNTAAKQLSTKPSSSESNEDGVKNENASNLTAMNNTNNAIIRYRRKRKRPFSYTFTTLPPLEPYDDVKGLDFEDELDDEYPDALYEEQLRQYEKDYEQYLKDYAEWNKTYGDLYRNAESQTINETTTLLEFESTREKQNTRHLKKRYT